LTVAQGAIENKRVSGAKGSHSLEAVLRLRRRTEEERTQELAEAVKKLEAAKAACDAARERLGHAEHAEREARAALSRDLVAGTLTTGDVVRRRAYIERLGMAVARASEELETARKAVVQVEALVESRRAALSEAYAARAAVEKYLERLKAEARKEAERKEEDLLDEIALVRHRRKE